MSHLAPISIFISFLAFCISIDISYAFNTFLLHHYPWQNSQSIRLRLKQLGRTNESDYENFRISQTSLIAIAWILPLALYFFSIFSPAKSFLLAVIEGAAIVVITERNLSQRCKRRRQEVESEFPAIVEMLTLAVGAGESPASAFRRIANRANGHFAEHIQQVVQAVEQGISFIVALDAMGREMDSDAVRLFTDSLVIAISRGNSLIETMEHAVQESRNQSRIHLISAASKSEISMLIPVVFLILPISILFALFPSLNNLNLFAS